MVEVGQNVENLNAHNSTITKLECSESGTIGFLAKFTRESFPQTLKFHIMNI